MWIKLDGSKLKDIRLSQYVVRFVLGGLITAGSGLVAQRFGPVAGGLFLAFPAIFPASATLLEKAQQTRRGSRNTNGGRRGRYAAAIEAQSSALGSIALMVFAIQIWFAMNRCPVYIILLSALGTWTVTAYVVLVGWRRSRHRKTPPQIRINHIG
jgi:hypothetical protein